VVTANAHLPLLAESTAGLERVLLTDEHTGIEAEPGRVVSWSEIATLPLREPLDPATEESLAYVMYTSGTTGHPKGVMVTHRAVATFHAWIESAFGVTDQDRFIPTSSIAFGASLRQLFSPLMAGARVVPAPPHLLRDPHALAGFLEERGISFWNSVPTLWGQLIDAIEEREREGLETRLEALRWVLIGGEDLPASLVRRWMDRFGARHRIVNLFGCAETIVNSVTHELRERPGPHERTIPIGRARRGVQAYVLDDDGNPCGSGEVGILHIGGEALAEGYMNEPELTRRAFPSTRWGRLYRTGDLARQDDQGIITYLGRGDDRVKVRGNRVELSEIEGTLRNHPEVRDAACASFQREGREWLVAFVILPQNAPPGWESALRDWVARHLPSYMVPHRFVQVQSFPLNANGKVDRRALGENLSAPRSSAGDGELTPTERTVLETWKEVLGELAVDRELDFFEAGGDSILAIEMFRRLRGRIAVVPRPVAIYANRTVAKLAQAIEELALTSGAVATPPTRRVEAGRLPLTPAQAGFVFLEDSLQREAPVWFADVPVHGEVDPERFRNALAEVIRRHPMLRAVFRREGAQWFQQVLPPCDPPLFIHDAPLDQQELQEVWADVRATRFELSQLPLFRVVLVRSATGPWRLMLAVHHIIGDAWSLHVVIEDLASALAGEELPALDASWSEVVAWHARTDPHRQASKDYWRGFFSRAPSPVRWAPSQGEELEGTLVRTVDRTTTARLREIARARATTLHACVLTVWFQSLRSELGEDDLTTGTASGGREIPVPDVERMVGCLATTLPVRAKVSGDFDTDLRAVSMAWEEAWQHGDVPVYESWLAAGAPHGSQAPGLDLYFSFMEFGSLAARRDAPLRFDLSSAELHFSTDSAGHRAMLTVLVDDAIRLQLRGDGSADRLRALAERMARGLEQLAGRTRAGDAVRSVKDDAAIVAYLPSLAGLTGALDSGADAHSLREHVLPRLFPRGEPQWMESTQTPLGRTAAVFLPLFSDELAQIPAETLAASVASAVRVAHARGARSVSLAGMLPSLTSYGHAVRRLLDPESAASLTTGHAATTAAVVATIRRALVALQRTWADQRVAIVGFGSMGQGIAGLMLSVLGRPRGLVVCDRREVLPLVAEAVHALERAGQVPVTMVG
ncbi:MAG TPA: AMP-binding protein, partial [Polyangiaceae bacterium]|nr:AMP-binding protein [Polyangiaceae bacterium]